jgi:hypothetical protein
MRCAEVRRSWHATLVDSSLWTRLDLSGASAVVARVTDALLRAASARAGGQLESLDVTDCEYITDEALLAVVTANAGALRELHVGDAALAMPNCEAILRAAPQLRVFGRAGFVLSAEQVEALFVIAPQLHTFYTRVGSSSHADAASRPLGRFAHGYLRMMRTAARLTCWPWLQTWPATRHSPAAASQMHSWTRLRLRTPSWAQC